MTSEPRTLTLVFLDEEVEIGEGEQLVFGRSGDFPIDENLRLHRQLGQLFDQDGSWYLRNVGSTIVVTGRWDDGRRFTLPSGSTMVLDGDRATLWFSAGTANYELILTIGARATEVPPVAGPDPDGRETVGTGRVALNDEQRQLLAVLASRRLLDPGVPNYDLPGASEAAARLGWTVQKLRRKLDYLCSRFSEAGVPGLYGGAGANAAHRQIALVEHVLAQRLVTEADLERLP